MGRAEQRQGLEVVEGGDVGQVKDTVQLHVDDGDVQAAEGIWQSRGERDKMSREGLRKGPEGRGDDNTHVGHRRLD